MLNEEMMDDVRWYLVGVEAEALLNESWDRISEIVDEIREDGGYWSRYRRAS